MCFSTTASFTAAAVLTGIGGLTLSKARSEKSRLLAMIPLLFGVQQALEGIVWLTLNHGDPTSLLHHIGVVGFLFIATLLWPVWTPASLYLLETNQTRKKWIVICLFIGALTSSLFSIYWYNHGMTAHLAQNHIDYSFPRYFLTLLPPYVVLAIGYLLSAVLPPFISSVKSIWIYGILILIGCIVTEMSHLLAFESLWCFFSAAASIVIYFVVKDLNTEESKQNTEEHL